MNRLPITDLTTIDEVCRMLNAAVRDIDPDADGGFSVSCVFTPRAEAFRGYCRGLRFLACYAVGGSSEGHYVHVDAVSGWDMQGRLAGKPLFLAKTFGGGEAADRLAAAARQLLDA